VLSPTHLHEFKSADKTGAPVMSLYLPEQKLGSHSTGGSSSNKFILKGRQTGTMHRGHTWVFRAESHDTMMAWYEDIKALTEKTPEELSNFVRGHARAYSRSSQRSASSDGMVDEEDEVPFSADPAVSIPSSRQDSFQNRSHAGGRFPSDIQVNAQRGLLVPLSPTSSRSGYLENCDNADHDVIATVGALPGSGVGENYHLTGRPAQAVGQSYGNTSSVKIDQAPSHAAIIDHAARIDGVNPYSGEHVGPQIANSGRSSNAPILVDGLVAANLPPASDTGTSGPSEDWDRPTSLGAQQTRVVDGEAIYGDGHSQVSADHSSLKQTPGFINDSPFRPGGQRNNSTPHVPGEYPRSMPSGTPGV
jgi:hypothetical protein